MDKNLLPQHKRLAMGLSVNNEPAGASKKMIGDMVGKHASYGIHKNLKGNSDKRPQSGLKSFDARK
jgi:hypothetical protein